MSRDGSGNYSLPAGNPVVTGTTISSTWANNTLADIESALTASIAKDGQTTPSANLPMGGYVHTGLGAGTANGHSVRFEQVLDPAGGNALTYLPDGTGAVETTVQDKLRETVSFLDFGAVGDGVEDDSAAILLALATGATCTGAGRTYGIDGNLTLPASVHIRDATFLQLNPGATTRRTLYQSAGTLCRLENIKVNINGDGLGGEASDAAGIYISGCARVNMVDVEVTGNDKGTGILLADCDDVTLDRPYVHDMKHGDSTSSDPGDDKMQGIWLIRGTRAVINSPVIRSLHAEWSGQAAFNRYTRGIAVSGTENFTINAPLISDVDQGIDISGDENPQYFSIVGGAVEECYTWGVKCANSTQDGSVLGTTAKRCGIAGFVASAPTVTMTYQTQQLDFIGCKAIATGYGNVWQATQNVCGFRVMNNSGAGYPDYPRSIRFIGCTMNASGATTEYGFLNDATLTANGDVWVEAIDCTSIGHTVQAYYGFHQGITTRQNTGTQSIPNNSWTDVTWGSNVVDRMDGDSGTTADITIRRSGLYMVCAGLEFASGSSAGTRGLRLTRNGSAHVGAYERIPAGDTNSKAVVMSFPILCDEGDILAAQAFQDSGGAININAGCAMSAALISPGQGRT